MTAQAPLRPGGATPAGGGTPLTLGSLCTGYGGLDMAVAAVLPVELAWVADNDAGASALLAHHHPDVPNLGDLSAVDCRQVQPVDVLTAGFPCQDISYAGRGAGIREGTRSGLWHTIADAVSVLRPRLLVLENVRAIVSRRPGLDVVLGDLASLGFDAEWTCVRASDVGAPHQRWRWFLAAHPADLGHQRGRLAWGRRPGPADGRVPAADAGRHPRPQDDPHEPAPARSGGTPADATRDGRDERRAEPEGQQGRPDAALGGGPAPDAHGDPVRQQPVAEPGCGGTAIAELADIWGRYAPAIARWERATGRPAPDPTEPGRDGKPRLNPVFVEWLMGLPARWVAAVPGLSRNQQLRLLGNGVVPQQGAAALAELLECAAVTS